MELTRTATTTRCHGCAFTPGTLANRDALVAVKIDVCLSARRPFFCHEHVGEVCRGFIEAVGLAEPPTADAMVRARAVLQWVAAMDAGLDVEPPDDVPVVEVP